MKWLKLGLLVTAICLPVMVLFTFDDIYNGTQDQICQQYSGFTTACQPDDRRYQRTGLVSTAFYRHLTSYLGRDTGATPAFIELVRSQTRGSVADRRIPAIEQQLRDFNRSFLVAINLALAIAGAACVIMVQYGIRFYRRWRLKSTPKVPLTRRRKPTTKTTNIVRKKPAAKSNRQPTRRKPISSKKSPRQPELIRPRQTTTKPTD